MTQKGAKGGKFGSNGARVNARAMQGQYKFKCKGNASTIKDIKKTPKNWESVEKLAGVGLGPTASRL